jgi:RNA polymerase sigma-70 factor (ECF subfamily)
VSQDAIGDDDRVTREAVRTFDGPDRNRAPADTRPGLATPNVENGPSERLAASPAPPSFELLYEQYYTYTSRTLRHLGLPLEDIEDAAQEVWFAVHRQLAQFAGRSSHRTWLFGIVVNVARNRRRSSRRRPRPAVLPEGLAAGGPDPELAHLGTDALLQVQRFLEPLDDERRVLFVAHLLEDLDAAEVAELLGVGVETVYQRVRALRRAFRRWFDEQQREGSA